MTSKGSQNCENCNKIFKNRSNLRKHWTKHTSEGSQNCKIYNKVFKNRYSLKIHKRTHQGGKCLKCDICPLNFRQKQLLIRHQNKYTDAKPYECEICHAKFTQGHSLKEHKNIHSRDRSVYLYALCTITCNRKIDLQKHVQRLHTSEGPQNCKICDKVFKDRYSLKMHKRTHQGEKCFKCDCKAVQLGKLKKTLAKPLQKFIQVPSL